MIFLSPKFDTFKRCFSKNVIGYIHIYMRTMHRSLDSGGGSNQERDFANLEPCYRNKCPTFHCCKRKCPTFKKKIAAKNVQNVTHFQRCLRHLSLNMLFFENWTRRVQRWPAPPLWKTTKNWGTCYSDFWRDVTWTINKPQKLIEQMLTLCSFNNFTASIILHLS